MIRLPSRASPPMAYRPPSARAPPRIYADNAATTAIRPSALAKYNEACAVAFGNPSSQHTDGKTAHSLLEWARAVHSRYMNVDPECVYFTSSGTESANIAIRGVMTKMRRTTGRTIIVTSSVEHSSVRKTAELAAGSGNHIMVPVNGAGYVDEEKFKEIMQSNARNIAMVSIILAQNEVGTLQRIPALVDIVRQTVGPTAVFHTDATQAFGKYFIDPESLKVDLLTASAHKVTLFFPFFPLSLLTFGGKKVSRTERGGNTVRETGDPRSKYAPNNRRRTGEGMQVGYRKRSSNRRSGGGPRLHAGKPECMDRKKGQGTRNARCHNKRNSARSARVVG